MELLAIDGLQKWFGGVKAVNGITLTVNRNEICAVIGPNGAGKTTLFNLISGYIKPDMGRVIFNKEDITGRSPKYITERGISRSFQIVNIFPRLSVYENILVAILGQRKKSLRMIRSAKSLEKEECWKLLNSIGLIREADTLGGQLSHGNQKRLEVGLALAMKPKLLLLDEPTAGMAVEEKAGILNIVTTMCRQEECTIFLCEHNMDVIFSVSDTIWVLNNGQVISHGSVQEVRKDETVRKIYLGENR